DPRQLLQQQPGQNGPAMQPDPRMGAAGAPQQEELTHFVKVILRDTELVWDDIFRQQQKKYRYPKLVLFTNAVDSACGLTSSAVGPFYLPEDERVYLDLGFYHDLRTRFGEPGDFGQAYVLAHDAGQPVQTLLRTTD